jgi:filamentous hemagglutinin
MGGLGGGGFGTALAEAAGAGLSAALAPQLNSLSKGIADGSGSTLLGNLASNVLASAGGALVGGSAGAFTAANADLYNRQLHPQEKTAAQQIAANAAAQGVTNPDGSPITVDQIENAMRASNNSQYGEITATGVVVPLNANTPASAVYDTTGIKLVTDSTGSYLVQDPSMLATPSQTLQDLITQNTGGANSPYSWGASTSQAVASKIDPYGPFSPTWNAGGVAMTNPSAVSYTPSIATTIGYIFGAKNAGDVQSVVVGDGNQAFVSVPTPFGVNAIGAITHAYGGSTAIEFGISPPASFNFGVIPWGHGAQVTGSK